MLKELQEQRERKRSAKQSSGSFKLLSVPKGSTSTDHYLLIAIFEKKCNISKEGTV